MTTIERQEYERELTERQKQHLHRIADNQSWRPCMHDQCQSCHGTGIRFDGSPCIHAIYVFFKPKSFEYGVEWREGLFYGRRHVSLLNLDRAHGIAKLSE